MIDTAPSGPKRSGGRPGAAFLYREECEPIRRGRKLRMAVAGWRSRRSRPSVTPDPSRSARVRPASIGQGTPIMARSLSAIPDGDRGDGTARSRWLPSARPAVSVDPSPTPHPHHVHDECAGRRRSYGGSSIARVLSDKRQPGFHGTSLEGGREEGMGALRNQQARGMPISTTPDPPSRGGARSACLPTAPARSEGPTRDDRRHCTAPLDVARRNELRPSRREYRPANLPEPPAPSPGTSRRGWPHQGTVSMSVCLNSSAVARMGTL